MLFRPSKKGFRNTKFGIEQLESRSLLAGDITCFHNIVSPEDADGSGSVTPLDALVVINSINSHTATTSSMTDVDGDSSTSPLDALIVVNFLNASNRSNSMSSVSPQSRIDAIEKDISSGTLAPNFTIDDAIEIIATLRAGGHPESGQRLHNGVLVVVLPNSSTNGGGTPTWVDDGTTDTSDSTDDTGYTDTTDDHTGTGTDGETTDPHALEHATHLLERLTKVLTTAGVSQDVITTISTEIKDAAMAGTPLTPTQIIARLGELGVDTATLFSNPVDHENDHDHEHDNDHEHNHDHEARFLAMLTHQLTAIGTSEHTIHAITQAITDAQAAGTPLTLTQIEAKLTELGVDVSKLTLFKHEHEHEDHFLAMLTHQLTSIGTSQDTIDAITKAIADAKTAGTPLTLTQIEAKLTELGVDVSKLTLVKPVHEDRLLAYLTEQLTTIGAGQNTIDAITKAITDAKTAGTPLTLKQIEAKLTELGVDVSKLTLFKHEHEHEDHFLAMLKNRLAAAGVTMEVITSIITAINDAKTAGTPLTFEQIKTKLTALGVNTSILLAPPTTHLAGHLRGRR